jgi:hypothetical protein
VARQLDWRVVEPPRHAAEILRARLPVRRPAHEATLQQRNSAWSVVAFLMLVYPADWKRRLGVKVRRVSPGQCTHPSRCGSCGAPDCSR